jgi:hypothetical protein
MTKAQIRSRIKTLDKFRTKLVKTNEEFWEYRRAKGGDDQDESTDLSSVNCATEMAIDDLGQYIQDLKMILSA